MTIERKVLYLYAVVAAACVGSYNFYMQFIHENFKSEKIESIEVGPSVIKPFREATEFSSVDNAAYVFLGLGAMAHQMNCEAAIESLVRYGGWDGQVYLITEQEQCFDEDEIVKNAGMKAENFHLTVLDDNFDVGVDLAHPKVGFSKNRLKSKSMKMKLFDIVTDPQIDTLAYVDCDVLFAQQGCAKEFVTGGVPWEERKIRFSRIELDPGNGRLVNIHAGTMVIHREHSKEVLKRWYDYIQLKEANMDRQNYLMAYAALQKEIDARYNSTGTGYSLNKTHRPQQQAPAELNVMLPSERLRINQISENRSHFEIFVNPDRDTYHVEPESCMLHFSKARCGLFGRANVQKVVDRFRLRTFTAAGGARSYQYCPNPLLMSTLYGWVPFSYLPFCPKVEAYL